MIGMCYNSLLWIFTLKPNWIKNRIFNIIFTLQSAYYLFSYFIVYLSILAFLEWMNEWMFNDTTAQQ